MPSDKGDPYKFELHLSEKDLEAIYSRFSHVLYETCQRNLRDDWGYIERLEMIWNKVVLPINGLAQKRDLMKRHANLFGMAVESVNLYFLSLWLAESNYINPASVILRSSLEGLAYSLLLDLRFTSRIHRLDIEANLEAFQKYAEDATKEINDEIRNDGEDGTSSAFKYLLRHSENYGIPLEQNSLSEMEELYKRLSKSVHEEAPVMDLFVLTKYAPKILDFLPDLIKRKLRKLNKSAFLVFASHEGRKFWIEHSKAEPDYRLNRHRFLGDFVKATEFATKLFEAQIRLLQREAVFETV